MSRNVYPKRYAQAVFALAQESNDLEAWQQDLDAIARAVSEPPVMAMLGNPRLSLEEKRNLLTPLVEILRPQAVNLLMLLVRRGTIAGMGEIAAEYRKLHDELLGRGEAEVTTAVPLDEETRRRIIAGLSDVTGKQMAIEERVDPSIIGGVIARVGDKLLDGSTRARLERLKQQLAAGEKRR